jgi:molybdopterin-guanine dinucleotide biosynthesis protein B
MALVKPYILQIVGYKNSGKTTFIIELVKQLTNRGMKVVTLKHHGHGGVPAVVEETDSSRHIKAGAAASLVEGGGRVLLQTEDMDWTLQQKLDILSFVEPDIILIEGYKQESFEKVVFIRSQEDLHLIHELKNIELILFKDNIDCDCFYRSFCRDDPTAIQWLVDYLEKQRKKTN